MTLLDLSDLIFRELGEPDTLSIPQISYWLQYNIGTLNILLAEATVYDEDTNEFIPELTVEQADIYKTMYMIKYYGGLVTTNLGAASYDWSQLTEGDTTVRRVSKNEIAKNYNSIKAAYSDSLNKLVFFYKQNKSVPTSYSRESLLTTDESY